MKIPFINKLFFPADSIPDTGEKPRRISDTLRKYLPGIFGFYLMLIAPAALSGKSGPFNTPGNDWVEKKSKSGITTAYRWITLENGDRFRQRKVEMIIDASLPAIVAAIKDDQSAKLWMKRVKTYYSFRETDNFHWSTYMEFSLP
jgi:hypothetical protein